MTTDRRFCWSWNIYIRISKPAHIHTPFYTNVHALILPLTTQRSLRRTVFCPGAGYGRDSLFIRATQLKTDNMDNADPLLQGRLSLKHHPFLTEVENPTAIVFPLEGFWPQWTPLSKKTLEIQSSSKTLPMATIVILIPWWPPDWVVYRPTVQDGNRIQSFLYFFLWGHNDYDAFLNSNSIWENFNLRAISRELSPCWGEKEIIAIYLRESQMSMQWPCHPLILEPNDRQCWLSFGSSINRITWFLNEDN